MDMLPTKSTFACVAGSAVIALLLGACAGSAPVRETAEDMSCPPNEVVVCRGGTVSKIGNTNRREPRFCQCRPRNDVDF